MNNKVPLLSALLVLVLGGFYVSREAPVLAADITWSYPAIGGCYTDAQGFIIEIEIDGGLSTSDTVFTNHYQYNLPAGSTSRFRVIGFFYDGAGDMHLGRLADPATCVPTNVPAWSLWSDPITTLPTIRQISRPTAAVIIK